MVIGGDHYKSNPSYENDEMTRDYFCAMEKSESVKVLYPIMKPNSCVGNTASDRTGFDLAKLCYSLCQIHTHLPVTLISI